MRLGYYRPIDADRTLFYVTVDPLGQCAGDLRHGFCFPNGNTFSTADGAEGGSGGFAFN